MPSMPKRGDNTFKRSELRRALRSAREEGFAVERFEIDPEDRRIVVYGANATQAMQESAAVKQWDDATEVLKSKKVRSAPTRR